MRSISKRFKKSSLTVSGPGNGLFSSGLVPPISTPVIRFLSSSSSFFTVFPLLHASSEVGFFVLVSKVFQLRVGFVKDVKKQEEMWETQHELAAHKIYHMCSDLGGFFLKVLLM